MTEIARYYSIYEQVKKFKVVSCNLKHEQVVKILYPIKKDEELLDSNGHLFIRKGFCTKEIRKKTISCAHSIAFSTYEKLILSHNQLRYNKEIINNLNEMKGLLFQIYLLDHKKGLLEKKNALEKENLMVKRVLGDLLLKYQLLVKQIQIKHECILQTIMQLAKNVN